MTTVLPAISACTAGFSARMNGPFHGVMMPTTPSGRYVMSSFLVLRRCIDGVSSARIFLARFA
jgi:hypothetical protein